MQASHPSLQERALWVEAGHPIAVLMTCDPDGSHLLFFYRAPFGSAFPTELNEMYLALFPLGRHWVYIFNPVCSSQQHSEE